MNKTTRHMLVAGKREPVRVFILGTDDVKATCKSLPEVELLLTDFSITEEEIEEAYSIGYESKTHLKIFK